MDDLIGCLSYVRCGDGGRSRRMRVEDADQLQPVRIDPLEGLKLFIGVHDEPGRTLSLIADEDYFFDPSLFPGQQTARLERGMLNNVTQHFIMLTPAQDQLVDRHLADKNGHTPAQRHCDSRLEGSAPGWLIVTQIGCQVCQPIQGTDQH